MSAKQGVTEDVYRAALQRLNEMVKAGLHKSQFPGVLAHLPIARLNDGDVDIFESNFRPRNPSVDDSCHRPSNYY
jgi:hypothetical protein